MPKASYNNTLESELFKQEGFVEGGLPYKDSGGTTTIGFGYTKFALDGQDGRPHWSEYWAADGTPTGKTMSKAEAKRLAPLVVKPYIKQANSLITNENLTESQRNAVVNLIYRNGIGNVKKSGVVDKLNSGDIEGAQKIIKENEHLRRSGGSVLQEGDVGYNGITSRNNNIADSLTVTNNSEPEYDPATDPSLIGEVNISERGVSGTYDNWKGVEPGDHENGDIIKVGDNHYEYQSNRATYAPHDIETGETEDFADGHGGIDEGTVGTNPERLPSGGPNPNYRKNRNSEGQYEYDNMLDVKKGKAKLKDGDELLVDGKVYKYDGETKDLISFSETGEIDEANNINLENIGPTTNPVEVPSTDPVGGGPDILTIEYPEVTQEMIDDGYTGKGSDNKSIFGGEYIGEWKDGKKTKGKVTFEDGKTWEGVWNKGGYFMEDGKITYANGDVYEGQLVNGWPLVTSGKGTFTHKDGTIDEGDFRKGNFMSGTRTLENGDVYESRGTDSTFDEDLEGGNLTNVKITYANGDVYEGELTEGEPNGGRMTSADGTINESYSSGVNAEDNEDEIINEEYPQLPEHDTPERDNFTGKGREDVAGGEYVGEWKDGKKTKGKIVFDDGKTWEGTWDENGHFSDGKITYANGDVYEGPINTDGGEEEGSDYGNPNGGTMTRADGTVENEYTGGDVVVNEDDEDEITDEEDEPTVRRTEEEIRNDLIKERVEAKHKENAESLSMTEEEYNELAREPYEEDFLEEVTNEVNTERDGIIEERDVIDPKDNKNNYSKNLNDEIIYTNPETGETTIIEGEELERIQPILNSRSTGDIIPGGSYEPFDRGDGNLVDGDLEIIGHTPADGDNPATYDVRTSDGQIITMPAEDMNQQVNSQGDIITQTPEITQEVITSEEVVVVEEEPIIEAGPESTSDFKQKATKALKTMGQLGESVMTGASSLLDAVGGPGAIVSYLMGKESLKDAMKEITPKQKANLSASFMEHLRQTKELQKRGFHPTEARAVQKEIDTAYQVGLEKSIRGTAGDRAKYLAQSGILDAKRSSALLEYSVKDAELQRTNQTKYTAMLNFKENFDAQRSEALRAEDMKAQQEKQKAASEFTGQMFKNVMSGLGGNKIGSFFQQNQAELTSFIDNITKKK